MSFWGHLRVWGVSLAAVAAGVAILASRQLFKPRFGPAVGLDSFLHHCHRAAQFLIKHRNVPDVIAALALKTNRLAVDPQMGEFIAARLGGPHLRGTKELEQTMDKLEPPVVDAMAQCMAYGLLASAASHPSRAENLQVQLREWLFEGPPNATKLSRSQMGRIGVEIIAYYERSTLAA